MWLYLLVFCPYSDFILKAYISSFEKLKSKSDRLNASRICWIMLCYVGWFGDHERLYPIIYLRRCLFLRYSSVLFGILRYSSTKWKEPTIRRLSSECNSRVWIDIGYKNNITRVFSFSNNENNKTWSHGEKITRTSSRISLWSPLFGWLFSPENSSMFFWIFGVRSPGTRSPPPGRQHTDGVYPLFRLSSNIWLLSVHVSVCPRRIFRDDLRTPRAWVRLDISTW